MTLPVAFERKMRTLLGTEASAFFESLKAPPQIGLRVNTQKVAPEAFRTLAPWQLKPVPWCPSGFRVEEPGVRPGLHPLHRAGVYYLQEPSAMAVAEALAPRPGEWVIDLASAPGGKSTQLASALGGQGLLVANEVDAKRVRALGENLERWGAKNAVITSESVGTLAQRWGAVFDRVLLDAPCSGEGMFRKSDEALAQWREGLVAACAARQGTLLAEASALVKPDGVMVYSTCTFAPEENEAVVSAFLRAHEDFRLEPLELPGASPGRPDWLAVAHPEVSHTARFWPHKVAGEGHFVARFRRTAGELGRVPLSTPPTLPRAARDHWSAFRNATLPPQAFSDAALALQGNGLFALPERFPALHGVRTLRPGLWLGTLKKNRFEPSHSLALALTPADLQTMQTLELSPDDPALTRYLRGDVLEAPGSDGWVVVTIGGFALGWGRRSQGVLKNFYPKGLRLPP